MSVLPPTTNNMQNFTFQADALSSEHQHTLASLHNALATHIRRTVQEINQQTSTNLHENKQEVKKTIEDLDKAHTRKISKIFLTIFSSLFDNLRDNDLTAFNFEPWITSNMTTLEESFGSQCVPSHKILNLINDITSTWTEKLEKIKAANSNAERANSINDISFSEVRPRGNSIDDLNHSTTGKDFEEISDTKSVKSSRGRMEMSSEGRARSEAVRSTPSSESRANLFTRMKSLFASSNNPDAGPAATRINLGNNKNFKYDPIKKRYVFDDDEDEPEEVDEGPPPTMMKSVSDKKVEESKKPEEVKEAETKKATTTSSMMLPPSHNHLARKKAQKKGAAGAAEVKKPSFTPSTFIPAAFKHEEPVVEENTVKQVKREDVQEEADEDLQKSATGEETLRRIEEIFERCESLQSRMLDTEKFKAIFENVEVVLGKEMKQKLEKEMEVILLQKELESTAETAIKESSKNRTIEVQATLYKEQLERALVSENDTRDRLDSLKKELEMYREICSNKTDTQNLANEKEYREKITEAHFKSLQEANEQKKKFMEARNKTRELEMRLAEKETQAKMWEERYKEITRQAEDAKKLPGKLRVLMEGYMKAQNEQDGVIIRLKEENCDILKHYRRVFEELGRMAEENLKIGEDLRSKRENIAALEKRLRSSEETLEEKEDNIREFEQVATARGRTIDELEQRLQSLLGEKKELEKDQRKVRQKSIWLR